MHIILNGDKRECPDSLCGSQLVQELGLRGKREALEVTLEIVPRSGVDGRIGLPGERVESGDAVWGG